MQMIGPQGEGLLKPIGAKLHSRLHTETSMPMLALCPLELLLAQTLPLLPVLGSQKNWIPLTRRRWSGYRRITWSTTIALMPKDFRRAFLQNAKLPNFCYLSFPCSTFFFIFFCVLSIMINSLIHCKIIVILLSFLKYLHKKKLLMYIVYLQMLNLY